MFQFCFNESIPKEVSNDGLVSYLTLTLKHFVSIKNQHLSIIDGIITDRIPSDLILNNSQFSLSNCIQYLDHDLKTIAYSLFSKYPVDNYYKLENEERLIENEYSISVDNKEIEAINAKIVEENGGILFTLQVHDDLKKNKLIISDKNNQTFEVKNLYGSDDNTTFISEIIYSDIVKCTAGFDKLKLIIGNCIFNDRFKKEFEKLSSAVQEKLFKEIEKATKRNGVSRFYADNILIKDVTPVKEREISVFELRIFTPVAFRLYFYETPDKIYLGSIEKKPNKKVQDNDILNAASVINELKILNP